MADEQNTPNEQVEPVNEDSQATEEQAVETSNEAVDNTELQKQLDAALAEAASLKDQMLRAAADVQNARRRAEQDVEKAHKFGLEKFANEMLPIVDSLERALDACNTDDAAAKALREGVEMTYGMFVSGLGKFQVEQHDPQGEAFDPVMHQAMSMVDAPDVKPNTVVTVMQKGYSLSGRLIRPAMVMVSKA